MSRARVFRMTAGNIDRRAIEEAADVIRGGGLVAFPTETVYGLGGDALDPGAARRIYAAKGRPSDNPLIVHIADAGDTETLAEDVPEAAQRLTEKFWPGPLTVILRKKQIVPPETTGGLDTVAIRFPDNAVAQALIRTSGCFIAAPSANRSGRPSPTRAEHVMEDLGSSIDVILDGGPVRIGLESTIVDFSGDIPAVLRPGYIGLPALREILGDVRDESGRGVSTDEAPRAPGMKYRHYAPDGQLTIVEGDPAAVAEEIAARVRGHLERGERAGVLCALERVPLYKEGVVIPAGMLGREETIARELYDALRSFDTEGVEYIYSEAFNTPLIGQAVMNRLFKAAGGRIIKC